MFSLLLLIGLCVGYYYLHQYYPRETKEQIYFGIFAIVSIVLIYLFNFEEGLIHTLFRNIYDIQKKPLYDLSLFRHDEKDNITNQFNSMILQNQGSRCAKCNNFILPRDSKYMSLQYRVPLNQGGTHDHSNLIGVCPNCNNYP